MPDQTVSCAHDPPRAALPGGRTTVGGNRDRRPGDRCDQRATWLTTGGHTAGRLNPGLVCRVKPPGESGALDDSLGSGDCSFVRKIPSPQGQSNDRCTRCAYEVSPNALHRARQTEMSGHLATDAWWLV